MVDAVTYASSAQILKISLVHALEEWNWMKVEHRVFSVLTQVYFSRAPTTFLKPISMERNNLVSMHTIVMQWILITGKSSTF